MPIDVGPERQVFSDALQPFMLVTGQGTIFIQGQLRFPPGYQPPAANAYPGIPGNVISRDGGKTWTRWKYERPGDAAYRPTGQPAVDAYLTRPEVGPIFEGAAVALRDGTVLIHEWIAQGPDAGGTYTSRLWESRDDLATLEGPFATRVHLPEGKGGFDDCGHPYSGLTFHRTILELPEASAGPGVLLACVYCWFKGDDTPCPYQPRMNKFRCVLLRSADRGRTWSYASTIAADPSIGEEGFDEPAMARVSRGPRAGRLVVLMRTGSNDQPLYAARSDDAGATWTPPRPLALRGVDPDLIELADGRLAALVGRRSNDRPEVRCYQIALSDDAGETWRLEATWNVEPHAGVDSTTYYGTLRELSPGRLLAAYDVGYWTHPVRYTAVRELTLR